MRVAIGPSPLSLAWPAIAAAISSGAIILVGAAPSGPADDILVNPDDILAELIDEILVSRALEELPVIGFNRTAPDDLRPRAQVSGRFVAARPRSKGRFVRVLPFCKPDNSDFRFPKTLAFAPKSKGVSHWGCARNRGSIKRLGLGRRRARLA